MYVMCVTVKVVPGRGDDFLKAAHRNRLATRNEPGNVRFDVLRGALPTGPDQPEEFFLFEVYRTPEDFPRHQQTEHYLRFRDEVADMMAEPRRGVGYHDVDADPWE